MIKTLYAPVFIPTLCRYEHFKRCVESLSICSHANNTELIIGLDYPPHERYKEGYNKIKEYITQINGFKKITLFEHKNNLGAIKNWRFLEAYCSENFDIYIGTEDDNEFSPCFLDYMNKALHLYWDNPKVSSVTGYSDVCCYNQEGHHTYFCYADSAWGLGMWRHKEKEIKELLMTNDFLKKKMKNIRTGLAFFQKFPARFGMLIQMLRKGDNWDDVKRSSINYFTGRYQLRPTISLCRNWGYDGSGEHCSQNTEYSNQQISSSIIFDYEFNPAGPNSNACKKLYRNNNLPNNRIKRFCVKLIFLFIYVNFIIRK